MKYINIKKNHYLMIFLLIISKHYVTIAQSTQVIKVPLSVKYDTKGNYFRITHPIATIGDPNQYKGYPACDTFAIYQKVIDLAQYKLSREVKGDSTFKVWLKEFNDKEDTSKIFRGTIKNYISVFSGLDKGSKYIIVDTNHNHDFSDETQFRFNINTVEKKYIKDTMEIAPLFNASYEAFEKGHIIKKSIWFRILPFNKAYGYKDKKKELLTVYYVTNERRDGTFTHNGIDYKVTVINELSKKTDSYNNFLYKIQKNELEYSMHFPNHKGEPYYIEKHMFEAINCSEYGDTISIIDHGYFENPIGGLLGFTLPTLKDKDAIGNSINIEEHIQAGKYILLDFWGSWCAPCIRNIPNLKKLYDQVDKSRVKILGINYEYNETGRKQAFELISRHGIAWPQIADGPSNISNVANIALSLQVKEYPTFILIAPNRKVIARETGEQNFFRLEQQLRKLMLYK